MPAIRLCNARVMLTSGVVTVNGSGTYSVYSASPVGKKVAIKLKVVDCLTLIRTNNNTLNTYLFRI